MATSSTVFDTLTSLQIRVGRESDCLILAELINESADGAVEYLFSGLSSKCSPVESMAQLLAQEVYYSYENAVVAEVEGNIIGMALSFPADGLRINTHMQAHYSTQKLQYIQCFVNNKITDSWHLDALCVHADYRNFGVGAKLLAAVKEKALDYKFANVGVFVFGSNKAGTRFYKRHGFVDRANIDTQAQEFLRDKKFLRLLELKL